LLPVKNESYGGGIWLRNGDMRMTNCTVYFNSSVWGDGIFCDGEFNTNPLTITNCTVSGFDTDSASFWLLNTIVIDAIHAKIRKGHFRNCDTNSTTMELFGKSLPILDSNGGPTKTISLCSSSKAIGAGVRVGVYARDTIIAGKPDKVIKMAYYNGSNWLTNETDSAIPPTAIVTEVTTDQRGVARANPPCIGAFEFTNTDAVATVSPAVSIFFKSVSLKRNNLRLCFSYASLANIELFDLSGRKLFSNSVAVKPEICTLSLPSLASGPLICRITTPQGMITQTLLKQQ